MSSSTSKLLKRVRARRNLEAAWKVIQENARSSKSPEVNAEIEKFASDVMGNLERLYRSLQKATFEFPPAKGIPIPKDRKRGVAAGIRPIVLATAEARIVQRAILNVLCELPKLTPYLDNPHSFGGIRKGPDGQIAAVPAATSAVLSAIGDGARFVMCADISGFFTRIPKSAVSRMIAETTQDGEFMELFDKAIHVELSNMAALRQHLEKFPIEDVGVAQGNSLSPLLGNILLHEFDQEMNSGDCKCIRYIDDFIMLAPSPKAAIARMRRAERALSKFEMTLSVQKTSTEPIPVTRAFEFLGIEYANGWLRPSRDAQNRLLNRVSEEITKSSKGFNALVSGGSFDRAQSLAATLRRVDGIVRGWGKHYFFCNDPAVFRRLDEKVDDQLRTLLGRYSHVRARAPKVSHRSLLGVEQLADFKGRPFKWPTQAAASTDDDVNE